MNAISYEVQMTISESWVWTIGSSLRIRLGFLIFKNIVPISFVSRYLKRKI